ncbi:hypothetical protein QYE76_045086 [Lolium multiflorum]|uniref:Uncharacterized protein n=1 Tax=Lolium multiflorum TaxID=4521 RepID=A0AAD8TLW1_LOLMU|nr:hypothetical protein QYE76_045086 [Lolium multiflorum]
MLDVATRFIGLETKNKHLRSNYELKHSRANVMADKLKAAEKALEEAKTSLAAVEQHLEDEKSSRKVRDEDICKRLKVLNTALLTKSYNLLELAKSFYGSDPFMNYRRLQQQSGVEVAMATLMAHGVSVDWKNLRSSYPKDDAGKRVLVHDYLREAQKYSGACVAMMEPTRGAATSTTPPPSTGTLAPEVP